MKLMIKLFREKFQLRVIFKKVADSLAEKGRVVDKRRNDTTRESGFTLMELLIVLALIATISMIAIPVYSNYLQRAKITEGLTLAKGIQLEAELYYALNGDWPKENAHDLLGLDKAESYRGNSVESIALDGNQITITYNDEIRREGGDSAKLLLTAESRGGSIYWQCQSDNIAKDHLPKECL